MNDLTISSRRAQTSIHVYSQVCMHVHILCSRPWPSDYICIFVPLSITRQRICWGGMLPHSAAQRFHLQLHHFYVDYIFRVFLRAGRTSLYNVVETESCRPHACASAVDDLGTKGISRQASLDLRLREIFTFIVNAPAPRLECLRRETFERCRTPMMKSSEPPRR